MPRPYWIKIKLILWTLFSISSAIPPQRNCRILPTKCLTRNNLVFLPICQNNMELFSPLLLDYCQQHTSPEDDILREISRETNAKVLMPRMLSGHLQGKALEFFSKMLRPKIILEIGTYTGYSAICMARGLAPGGKLITVDINEELETMVRGFFEKSGLAAKIEYKIGNALDILPNLEGNFDLVFIDADKSNY